MLTFWPQTSAGGVAEQPLGRGAEGLDDAALVDHDHRVGHGVEDRAQQRLPFLEAGLGALRIGDVGMQDGAPPGGWSPEGRPGSATSVAGRRRRWRIPSRSIALLRQHAAHARRQARSPRRRRHGWRRRPRDSRRRGRPPRRQSRPRFQQDAAMPRSRRGPRRPAPAKRPASAAHAGWGPRVRPRAPNSRRWPRSRPGPARRPWDVRAG